AARVSRHPASDGHSASRSSPCARVAGRWPARPATIADRTTRTPASRGDSQSGSWSRPDGRSGWTSGRPPSRARSRLSSGTGGCELRNLSGWCRPAARAVFHDILPAFRSNWRIIKLLSSVNRSSWYPWQTLARSEPTHTASAGGQLKSPEPPARGSPRDLAISIDAGEIDGPDRGTAGL